MDMSPAYIKASARPAKAQIVFAHLHVINCFNEKLSDLRRELVREATDQRQKDVLKGSLWLLPQETRTPLDRQRHEPERLERALKLNARWPRPTTSRRTCDNCGNSRTGGGSEVLTSLVCSCDGFGIRILQNSPTPSGNTPGHPQLFQVPDFHGPWEGTTNKIRTMQSPSVWFRDPEFFNQKSMPS